MKTNKNCQRPSSQNSNKMSSKKVLDEAKKEQSRQLTKDKMTQMIQQMGNQQNPQTKQTDIKNAKLVQNLKLKQKLNELDLQKIFQLNKQYFMQKVTVNDIPKPASHSFKMPAKIGLSEYSKQFHKNVKKYNNGHIDRPDNLNNSKANVAGYQTTYKTNFQNSKTIQPKDKTSQVKRDIKQLLKKKELKIYVAEQKPSFMETSYHFNYGNKKAVPAESAKRKECSLMGGGQFRGQTSYHNNFKGVTSKHQKPIHQTNNKLFMSLITPKQTTYDKQFNHGKKNQRHKTIQVVASCKPKHQSVSKGRNMRIHTQYQNSYQSTEFNTKVNSTKNFSCLNAQQLKQFILNL